MGSGGPNRLDYRDTQMLGLSSQRDLTLLVFISATQSLHLFHKLYSLIKNGKVLENHIR